MNTKTSGPLRSDETYPLAELKRRTGWGDSAIRAARRAGLKPVRLHGRVFYRGCDVVAYIDKEAEAVGVRSEHGK